MIEAISLHTSHKAAHLLVAACTLKCRDTPVSSLLPSYDVLSFISQFSLHSLLHSYLRGALRRAVGSCLPGALGVGILNMLLG